ncbi:Coronin-like protein crn1 [Balamuthia mandrillaris]
MQGTTTIRASKYRHLQGKEEQLRNCYGNIELGSVAPDANLIHSNTKFFAVPYQVKGSLCVVPLTSTGAVDREDLPLILQEDDHAVNDFKFHSFNEHLVATASQDGKAYLWQIPEEGLTQHLTQPLRAFAGHPSRLILLQFHPLADNVMVTVGADKEVVFWDVEQGEEKLRLPKEHKGLLSDLSWNYDGSLVATICKDKALRIFDPRSSSMTGQITAFDGARGGKCSWMGKMDKILVTGHTRQSERETAIFDPRNLSQRLFTQGGEPSPSPVFPIFDEDSNVVFLVGKGDGNIKMFEVVDSSPFFQPLLEYKTSKPQAGISAFPKRSLNVMDCEIARFLKLSGKDVIPVSFTVPRQHKDFFQDDLFPNSWDGQPTATAEEWFGGANNQPNLVSLEPK